MVTLFPVCWEKEGSGDTASPDVCPIVLESAYLNRIAQAVGFL